MIFISKHQKALLQWLIYPQTNFQFIHEAVYPVGVTTNWYCFTQIIGQKSLTIHWICTKSDSKIHHWTPVMSAKFQRNRIMRLCFVAIFGKCAKRWRKKTKKKYQNFSRSYLGNGLGNVLQIWNVDSPNWWATLQEIWFQSDKRWPR